MKSKIYAGKNYCHIWGCNHNIIEINDNTTITEFSHYYYLKPIEYGCENVYDEEGRFCVLVWYFQFMQASNDYIDKAFDKTQDPIADHVHWRDIKHRGSAMIGDINLSLVIYYMFSSDS